MSTQQLISTIQPLPVQEKLALIEFLSRSIQQELSKNTLLSDETQQTLSLIQNDLSWNFMKNSEEDIYSEANIKERR